MPELLELPTHFISHGGGPWPWMPEERATYYAQLDQSLSQIIPSLPRRPKAILMLSAHWEEPDFTVQSTPKPGMIYDYYGFPEHTYSIHYSSPGSPELAERVVSLLQAANIPVQKNESRGYDHGMYSPMESMNPAADIPVAQLSLHQGLDPAEHIALGQALRPLRAEDILIVGSGLSYHNLRRFGPPAAQPSQEFDRWLTEVLTKHKGQERQNLLENWASAPSARIAHPREEHLIPLMVNVGCAMDSYGVHSYQQKDFMGGVQVSNFSFA